MGARHSWWQQIQKHQRTIGVAAIVFIVVVVITLIIAIVLSSGTGFNGYNKVTTVHTISGPSAGTVTKTEEYQPGKTLWDWLQLLIIPLALAIIAIFFNRAERKNEQRIASDNQQEAALQGYINEMSELLLHEKLRESQPEDEVRTIARVRTMTTLPRLDEARKGSILQFLYWSKLTEKGNNGGIILNGADLRGAKLIGAKLIEADLRGTFLSGAYLSYAYLSGADLRGADLSGADLRGADLGHVNLSHAYLNHANLSHANLTGALLSEAYLGEADLSDADLQFAHLDGTNLKDAIGITLEELEKQTKLT